MPVELVGAWERVSVSIDGSTPAAPATVVWLQGRSAFGDLRLPRDGVDAPDLPYATASVARCFAGHATFEPPNMRWSHTIDLAGVLADQDDVGHLRWHDGDLVEEGTFLIDGIAVPYVEVWRRLPDSTGRVAEITDTGFVHVAVGDHSLTIDDKRASGGSFTARYQLRGERVLSYGPDVAAVANR
ncbi:MAG: hypothetical protein QOF97_2178 [Acidimicrobiaceae bacterium]|jgi:hypothetical protein